MPVFCAIVNCKSRSDRDSKIKFYRIPAEIVVEIVAEIAIILPRWPDSNGY